MQRIYLDHAATTPVDSRVREAMLPFLGEAFHNPSSLYAGARAARKALDLSRDTVAGAIGCLPGEVVFTSSGTEAANLAILGTGLKHRDGARRRILMSAAEHHCVLNGRPILERLGFEVVLLPVRIDGSLDTEQLAACLAAEPPLLVCAMHSNNETGALTDVAAVRDRCREVGCLWLCDAVQSFGLMPMDFADLGADFVALSAHKIYGPKGSGALIVRAGTQLTPVTAGGGQERELRAGTENVAGIVGFAEAARLAVQDASRPGRLTAARQAFEAALGDVCIRTIVGECRLPGHSHLRFPGKSAESMLINLDRAGVDASSGSACSSGSIEPSHVLHAAGWEPTAASEALRFTFGADSTLEHARAAAAIVLECALD